MKTRNSLLWVGVPLALLAFGSVANATTEGRQMLPNLDCETLKGQDFSTMDLYALQEKWGACFRTITVAHDATRGCPMHERVVALEEATD
jgi:hypothetical protein